MLSGYRRGARVLISEVTKKGNEVRHQQMNFTATNLQIPEGEKSYVRKFVCEMWSQRELFSRSEVAELKIIGPGKIIKGYGKSSETFTQRQP